MADKRIVLEVVVRPSDRTAGRCQTQATCWVFPGKAVVVGRSLQDADLPISEDPSLSKRHFSVAFDGQRCRLADLASKNGTRVNGNLVDVVDLQHGDVVCAGQTVFRVRVADSAASEAADKDDPLTVRVAPDDPADARAHLAEADLPDAVATAAAPADAALFLTLTVLTTPSVSSDDLKASRMMAWIRAGQTILVGRSSWNSDWTFRGDDRMSARHFSVSCDGRRCLLQDQGSANGTLINDRPVKCVELDDGDRIRAGQTEFAVQILGREQGSLEDPAAKAVDL